MVFAYNSFAVGRLAQLVEHPLDVRKVAGSSPTSSTIKLHLEKAARLKYTGLAVDFALYLEDSGATADFTGTGDYAWLVEHAWEYGFIRRYPENKRDVTGIAYEAWHFRYVGVPHAWYMQENGLCLEEYLQLLREKTSEAAPLRFTCQGIAYAVYAAASPPAGGAADCSADNLGGYIVTMTE